MIIAVTSCIHLGARETREDLFGEFINAVRRSRARLCLVGDTLDMGGYVGTKQQGSTWDQAYTPDQQIERAVKYLKPVASQIELILQGNHEERLQKATSIEANKHIATMLGIREKYATTTKTLTLGGHRIFFGHGGSPSDFQKILRGHEGHDIIALGHTHTLSDELVIRRSKAGRREVRLIRCGTFLEEPRYGKMALYPPNPIGAAWLDIANDGRVSVDLGVIPRGL